MRTSAFIAVGLIATSTATLADDAQVQSESRVQAEAQAEARVEARAGAASTSRSAAYASVRLSNGIYVSFSVEGAPGGTTYSYSSDTITRGFTDPANCSYFGYQVTVKPTAGNRIEISLGPLEGQGEERVREQVLKGARPGCTSPRAVGVPRFPAPSVLDDGEGLSIDLLTNPQTGTTITDHIRVSRHAVPRARSETPVRDLSLEELPFGVFPLGRLSIDGEAQPGSCGSRGSLIYLWLPRSRERFVFSLVPRAGYDFKKVGLADGSELSFVWDGVRYAWVGEEPVVANDVRCPVWVMKDDRDPTRRAIRGDGLVCGSGDPAFVLGRR